MHIMNQEKPTNILFVSNGHGEDSIAASIIAKLPPSIVANAYPIIGEGASFRGVCDIVGPRSHIPSQGWRHAKGSVIRDLPAMLLSIPPALSYLKSNAPAYQRVVVVGDTVGVFLCNWAGVSIDVYIDVFKTGQAHKYRKSEIAAIRRACKRVFCRDDILAKQLDMAGISAVSHGNIMLDTITRSPNSIPPSPLHKIALLPGSRHGTEETFALQVQALELVADKTGIVGYLALADGILPHSLAERCGLEIKSPDVEAPDAEAVLVGKDFQIFAFRRSTGNIIEAADIVLSQSGTATQQALGIGKPVITFFAARHRRKRMDDEQALMGEARILTAPTAQAVAAGLTRLLEAPDERARLGKIGKSRLGGRGTLNAVLASLGSARLS